MKNICTNKKLQHVIALLIMLFSINAYSENYEHQQESGSKTVTLVVSGEGATKEEATTAALRNAIEQAFGTFVSANTKVVNDEIVRDEIVTMSNGNILNYKEISTLTMSDGSKSVTVQTTVSLGNLVKYANNKGMQTELSGATFLMNKRMEELYTKNEKKVFQNMLEQYTRVLPVMFDFKVETGEPKQKDEYYLVPCCVKFIANENTIQAKKLWVDALDKLNVGINYEIVTGGLLAKGGKQTEHFITFENFHDKIKIGSIPAVETTQLQMYFRNDYSWVKHRMRIIFEKLIQSSYVLKDNFGIHYANFKGLNETEGPTIVSDLITPMDGSCSWYFGNQKKMFIPPLNLSIELGQVMYEQNITLVYTEKQMESLSNIAVLPNPNFDDYISDLDNAEDYISTDGNVHLLFDGVYLDGSLDRVITSLENKGYKLSKKTSNISAVMNGTYLGYDVELFINTTKNQHNVWGINIRLPECKSWEELKSCYYKMKELFVGLTDKYRVFYEKFEKPFYDGCGNEMEAVVVPQKCLYATDFYFNDGFVGIVINNDKCVYLLYRDNINFQQRK